MLFFITLIFVPAIAVFSFQLICYANYEKNPANPSSTKWSHRVALQNG